MIEADDAQWFYTICGLHVRSPLCLAGLKPSACRQPDVEIRFGKVPDSLPHAVFRCDWFDVSPQDLIVRTGFGVVLRISAGNSITIDCSSSVSYLDVCLLVMGSAWGALCQQRGYLPLHMSAVTADGGLVGFAGPSGSGKSTLAAALALDTGNHFSDDVCFLDPSHGKQLHVWACPKGAKLWPDAMNQLGCAPRLRVSTLPQLEKYYVDLAAEDATEKPEPLRLVYMLEDSTDDTVEIIPVRGIRLVDQLFANIYRLEWYQYMRERRDLLKSVVDLAGNVRAYRFVRPRNWEAMDRSNEVIKMHMAETLAGKRPHSTIARAGRVR